LTSPVVKIRLTVEVTPSALKQRHCRGRHPARWTNAVRIVPIDYQGEERLFVVGPARHGPLLELVAVPADAPARVIHADRLRPTFYDRLTRR
jgi:hypothetical protein